VIRLLGPSVGTVPSAENKVSDAEACEHKTIVAMHAGRKLLTPEMIARIETRFHLPKDVGTQETSTNKVK
jgi:hypothetical protein